jgi:hypothetical protein
MDIAAQGRFCQSCQKTVVDFTQLTDQQTIELLASTGNTCGRFAVGQLERVNTGLIPPQKVSSFSWKKFSIAAAFIGFVPFITAEAQVRKSVAIASVTHKKDTLRAIQASIEKNGLLTEVVRPPIDSTTVNSNAEQILVALVGGISIRRSFAWRAWYTITSPFRSK